MSNANNIRQDGPNGAVGGSTTAAAATAHDMPTANGAAGQTSTSANVPVVPQDGTRDITSRLAYVPRDASIMALILEEMGVEDVQPPALMMLLEFAQRYLHEVLQDALVYADHANSAKTTSSGVSTLSIDDVQLAIQSRVNHSFTGPPNKDVLLSLASTVNSVPLPTISDKYGVKLPPAQHCLTNVNFSIVPNPLPDNESEEEEHEEDEHMTQDERTDLQRDKGVEEDDDDDENDDDNNDEGGEKVEADQNMEVGKESATAGESRGTKRSLDEDEEYD